MGGDFIFWQKFDTFLKSLKNKVIPVFLLDLFQASLLEE